jgi:hypothetical protein
MENLHTSLAVHAPPQSFRNICRFTFLLDYPDERTSLGQQSNFHAAYLFAMLSICDIFKDFFHKSCELSSLSKSCSSRLK